MKKYLLSAFALISLAIPAFAADLSVSQYYDSRDYGSFTLQGGLSFAEKAHYKGYIDLYGTKGSQLQDFNRFYSKNDLNFDVGKKVSAKARLEVSSRVGDQIYRFGPQYKLPLGKKFDVAVHYFPIQSKHGQQLGYEWSVPIVKDKVHFEGFGEHEFDLETVSDFRFRNFKKSGFKFEPQVRYQIEKGIGIVYEYRYNGFYPDGFKSGHAVGVCFCK